MYAGNVITSVVAHTFSNNNIIVFTILRLYFYFYYTFVSLLIITIALKYLAKFTGTIHPYNLHLSQGNICLFHSLEII